LPVYQTATAYLLLDRLDASGIVWGIAIAMFAFWWLAVITEAIMAQRIDIFKETSE
jgi:hypothetical protein